MESDLRALEERIRLAADLVRRLRSEIIDLRQRIATLESDNRRLADKVDTAAVKLESLLKQIPE